MRFVQKYLKTGVFYLIWAETMNEQAIL